MINGESGKGPSDSKVGKGDKDTSDKGEGNKVDREDSGTVIEPVATQGTHSKQRMASVVNSLRPRKKTVMGVTHTETSNRFGSLTEGDVDGDTRWGKSYSQGKKVSYD